MSAERSSRWELLLTAEDDVPVEMLGTSISRIQYHALESLTTEKSVAVGRQIALDMRWEVPGFQDRPLSLKDGWALPSDAERTWLWHVHQLTFLRDLIAADRTGHDGALRIAIDCLICWWEKFADCREDGRLAWHDHATALRLNNIVLLISRIRESTEEKSGNYRISSNNLEYINVIANKHIEILSDASFYSRGNNHGLDQSLSLFLASNEVGLPGSHIESRELAIERVRYEIGRAFSGDGGHIENSPAYQYFGVKQALEAANLGLAYGVPGLGLDPAVLAKAVEVLTHMIRPDGLLPYVGDTKQFRARNLLENTEHKPATYDAFLYSVTQGHRGQRPEKLDLFLGETGWAFMRSNWGGDREFSEEVHLTFKCGFISKYHRHDDDLSFTLYGFGEEWVIDSGLYKYEEKEPHRRYLRSAAAHSLSSPASIHASRDISACTVRSRIYNCTSTDATSSVCGETGMFPGYIGRRRLVFDRSDLSIAIHDEFDAISEPVAEDINRKLENKTPTFVTRFIVPRSKKVVIDQKMMKVSLKGRNKELELSFEGEGCHIRVIRGRGGRRPQGWRSVRPGELEPANVVEFQHSSRALRGRWKMKWKK